MEILKKVTCRLCLNIIDDEEFEVIGDITRALLNALSLKLTLDEKDIMCGSCATKLLAAYNFKSRCIDLEDTILTHTNSENEALVDIRDVYLKEKGHGQSIKVEEDQKICRLCFQLVNNGFRRLTEVLLMVHKYMPEVNCKSIKNPVVCQQCFHSLEIHNDFLEKCSDSEEKIKHTYMDTFSNEVAIKAEEVEIKSEDDKESPKLLVDVDQKLIKKDEGGYDFESTTTGQQNETQQHFDDIVKQNDLHDSPHFEPGYATQLQRTSGVKHDISKEQTYICDKCNFQAKRRCSLVRHLIRHRDPSEVRMYKCDKCDVQTKQKGNLIRHQLQHKEPSELLMYKCDLCDFQTKRERNLMSHQLLHKDPSELKMYKCDKCDFHTKFKHNLKLHKILHKGPSEVQMYKCDLCDFQTKQKRSVMRHRLKKHTNPSKGQTYKCDECDFQTKRKSNLTIHQSLHERHIEMVIYKCDKCDFQTHKKVNLGSHKKVHKDLSELKVYKCGKCDFKTSRKSNFVRHQLRHSNPSEVQMYKCDKCDLQTKYKNSLVTHQLRHGDPSQDPAKSSLVAVRHQRRHCGPKV